MTADTQHRPLITIINNCLARLALDAVGTVDATRMSNLALTLVNDVLADLSGYGDWQEALREVVVTAATSTNRFKVQVTANASAEIVKNILALNFGHQTQHLMPQSILNLRRWIRTSTVGTPRHFAVVGTSAANPIIMVYPEPVTAAGEPFQFQSLFYAKHRILVTADNSVVPLYNAKLVEQGLYVKLLLEEAGGEANPQVQAALAEYERMKREELNRFNYDTGDDEIQFFLG